MKKWEAIAIVNRIAHDNPEWQADLVFAIQDGVMSRIDELQKDEEE